MLQTIKKIADASLYYTELEYLPKLLECEKIIKGKKTRVLKARRRLFFYEYILGFSEMRDDNRERQTNIAKDS